MPAGVIGVKRVLLDLAPVLVAEGWMHSATTLEPLTACRAVVYPVWVIHQGGPSDKKWCTVQAVPLVVCRMQIKKTLPTPWEAV